MRPGSDFERPSPAGEGLLLCGYVRPTSTVSLGCRLFRSGRADQVPDNALAAAGGDPGTETIQRSAADADEGLAVGAGPIWKASASGVPGNSRATCLVSSSITSTSGTLSLRTVPTQRKPVAGTVGRPPEHGRHTEHRGDGGGDAPA